jgi:hypothetical protein
MLVYTVFAFVPKIRGVNQFYNYLTFHHNCKMEAFMESMISIDLKKDIIDEEHLRLLSLFHFIKGGITAAFSLLGLLYFLFLGFIMKMGSRINMPSQSYNEELPFEFISYFFIIAGVIVMLFLFSGILQLVSGYYLKRKKYRLFSFIIGIIEILEVPYGTILGLMTLIVLSRDSVKRKYEKTNSV